MQVIIINDSVFLLNKYLFCTLEQHKIKSMNVQQHWLSLAYVGPVFQLLHPGCFQI